MAVKLSFKELSQRITGISSPIFGVSWTPPANERKIVRDIITYLEDKRSLYYDYYREYSPWVFDSIIAGRRELTKALQKAPENAEMVQPLQAMRAACRKFLDATGTPNDQHRHFMMREMEVWVALGELCGVFGLHLARLCISYGVDVPEALAEICPVSDNDIDADDES